MSRLENNKKQYTKELKDDVDKVKTDRNIIRYRCIRGIWDELGHEV